MLTRALSCERLGPEATIICGDESIAGFEYSLRDVSAQTARAAGD
jgi:hypothetical protein